MASRNVPAPNTPNNWDDWLRDWEYSIRAQHRPQTVIVYLCGLTQLRAHLAQAHPQVSSPEQVSRRHVESWLASLAADGRGAAESGSRSSRRSSAGCSPSLASTSPTTPPAGVRAPDVPVPPVPVVDDDDLRAVLGTCSNGTFVDLRDAASIRILAACGLRRGKLWSLDVDDVDMRENTLTVADKGGKPLLVSTGGSKTSLAVSRYLRLRRKHPGAALPALFLASRPDSRLGHRLQGGGVAQLVKRRCKLAGVPVFHPHQLRHTWAHVNKQAGLSDEDLERMAGWSSPLMVRRYGRALADERARDAQARLAMGDRL